MQDILSAVEKNRQLILDTEKYVWENPETGYKEYKTSKYMEEQFEKLGYTLTRAENITGFYTVLDTGREGATVLILGELDSIICPGHPDADKVTGAVHSCGHNAQCAALVGIAAALKEPGILEKLSGKIKLCAVPAEELLEIEYRSELKKKGIIKHFGGKPEFLSRGYFDDVDVAFMVHTSRSFSCLKGSVGCIAQKIIYKGVAAHAGGSPWLGRNALYAATAGINAVNAIRETFKEDDIIRVHPIITRGGDMVNAIPETVTIESYVRGKSFEAIEEANKRVKRAFIGAALSLGTNIEIIDIPGYAPHVNSDGMIEVAKDAFKQIFPDRELETPDRYSSGSTDMGDLSSVMPVIHPYAAGAVGKGHGNDYRIESTEDACINSAKWQLAMLLLLTENGSQRAFEIKKNFKPKFESIKAYLDYVENLNTSGDRIEYSENNSANVKLI